MIQGNIKPQGWLLEYLKTQMNGLTGHIEQAGFPYDRQFWGADKLEPFKSSSFWWPFEQTAYYIDGYVRTAVLLGDPALISKAEEMIYPALEKADEDGYIGPLELKEIQDDCTRWPHVVFFRACLALYEYNKDERIIEALTHHYLGYPVDYSKIRNVYNVEIMLELYRINKNKALLNMAWDAYETGINNFVAQSISKLASKANIHGVTYNEYAKLGALLYRATGRKKYLNQSIKAYKKIERMYMLPGGCNSSSEYMLNDRYDEVYETCDIADMSWSLHYLASICDDVKYSDMIEKCVFNAGIGSVTEDFRALQYFSCANQIFLDENASICRFDIGGRSMAYSPMPFTACCTGNVNRIMPNYVHSMWDVEDNTVTARMYGPSILEGEIDGHPFSITEKTSYPFRLDIELEIKTEVPFSLRLRVPEWCRALGMSARSKTAWTGKKVASEAGFQTFEITEDAVIHIEFYANIVEKENHGGVYFERGPLVYSLGMTGERSVFETIKEYPSYRLLPNKKWNYAVAENADPEFCEGSEDRWSLDADIPHITVSCKEVENWRLRRARKMKAINWQYEPREISFGKIKTFTPSIPKKGTMRFSENTERIALYPYGASKLRMTVLPKEEYYDQEYYF